MRTNITDVIDDKVCEVMTDPLRTVLRSKATNDVFHCARMRVYERMYDRVRLLRWRIGDQMQKERTRS